MPSFTNFELISKAAELIHPHRDGDHLMGDVGCALVSEKGDLYLGVCLDIGTGSYCAEPNAIGSMVTAGEYRIQKIVAVWKDEHGALYVIPPCGHCRQYMLQVDPANISTQVILGRDKVVKLAELLPYHDLWQKIE